MSLRARSNISYNMTKEDKIKYMQKKMNEKKIEEERLKRLSKKDEMAFNIYDKLHSRMIMN